MVVYQFDDMDAEDAAINAADGRRTRFQVLQQTVTPQMAQLATEHIRAYPHQNPSVVQALVQAGIPADHPAVNELAKLQAQVDAEDGKMLQGQEVEPGLLGKVFGTVWDVVTAPLALAGEGAAAIVGDETWDTAGDALQTGVRGAFTAAQGAYHELVARPYSALFTSMADPNQDISDVYYDIGPSPLVRAWQDYFDGVGPRPDWRGAEDFLGTGFVPGGKHTADYEAQTKSTQIPGAPAGNHITLGRSILYATQADEIIEPGTKPYYALSGAIDFAASVYLDPASKVGKANKAARQFHKTFGAEGSPFLKALISAGGVPATRKTVVPETVKGYLDSPIGRQLVERLAQERDFTAIWKPLGKKGFTREDARYLADQSDPDMIRMYLESTLGLQVRERPTAGAVSGAIGGAVGAIGDVAKKGLGARAPEDSAMRLGQMFGVGAAIYPSFQGSRAFTMMPKTAIRLSNLEEGQETLDRFMREAKLPDATIRQWHDEFSRIEANDPARGAKVRQVVVGVLNDVDTKLRDAGVDAEFSQRATRMFEKFETDLRSYFQKNGIEMMTEGGKRGFTAHPITGQTMRAAEPTAHLLTELADYVPIVENIQEFRRATGHIQKLMSLNNDPISAPLRWAGKAGRGTQIFSDRVLGPVMQHWANFTLLRGAWLQRVTLDSQGRMAAAGLDSAFRHPIDYILWGMHHNPDNKRGKVLPKALRGLAHGEEDLLDRPMDAAKEFHAAMNKKAARHQLVATNHGGRPKAVPWGHVAKDEGRPTDFLRGWVGEMSLLWNDEIAKRVAGGLKPGDSTGAMALTGNVVDDVSNWLFHGNGREYLEELSTVDTRRHLPNNVDAVRRYVGGGIDGEGMPVKGLTDRINYQTGGNQELIDAIANGHIDGIDLLKLNYDRNIVQKAFKKRLHDAPIKVKIPHDEWDEAGRSRIVDTAFEVLFSLRDDQLNRMPAFRQNYWKRVVELVDYADDATQQAILQKAIKQNLPKREIRDLERRINNATIAAGNPHRLDDLEQVDMLAKDFALEQTKKLLYDTAEKSNFAEGARFVLAFAEAWKEIMQTWSKLVVDNPTVLRRGQQIVDAARDDNDLFFGGKRGFLYVDPVSGKEMFAYPFAGTLTHALLGMPGDSSTLQQEAMAAGLNLFSQTVLPGMGPVTTLGVGEFLPDKPEFDDLREVLMPFGGQDVEGLGDIAEHFTPSYARKILSATFGDRIQDDTWMSTVTEMSDYLLAQAPGTYFDANGQINQQLLARDAKKFARGLLLTRGAMQWSLPTGPEPTFYLKANDGGEMIHFGALGTEKYKLIEKLGFEQGTQEFIKRFGIEALLASSPSSVAIRKRALSVPGARWERENPELAQMYSSVIGYFAPTTTDPNEDFDLTAWGRAKDNGDYVTLSLEDRIRAQNRIAAYTILDVVETRYADHPDQDAVQQRLSDLRKALAIEYPGVFERVGPPTMSTDSKIAALQEAIQDPKLAATDAGKALMIYLKERQRVNEAVSSYSESAAGFASAKSTKPLRDHLRSVGNALVREYQDFLPMWEEVFSREGRMSIDSEYTPDELAV